MIELAAILYLNSGHLVYTLDDPYIHLSLAENIFNGHYGINANEVSAPSSSILWPFILAPFAWAPFMHHIPLFINIFSSLGTLFLFWKILLLMFSPNSWNILKANTIYTFFLILLIPATNLIGLIFTGMEHSLQVFLVTLIIWGLINDIQKSKITFWLLTAIILAPLIRYENLAISIPALFYLFFRRYRKTSIILACILIVLVGGYSAFLMKLGLGSFPTSVISKSSIVSSGGSLKEFIHTLENSLRNSRGLLLAIGMLYLFSYVLLIKGKERERLLAGITSIAIALHLFAGEFGWYCRYEIYIWVVAIIVILFINKGLISKQLIGDNQVKLGIVFTLWMIFLCAPYVQVLFTTPIASNNIYEQQYQMHRFIIEYYKKPVAVNDLGYVSYHNNNYVLDLRGLASIDALNFREDENTPEWMDKLSKTHNVQLAMIYDEWFEEIPKNWCKIGELQIGKKVVTPAQSSVSFYALNKNVYEEITELVYQFRKTLPNGVTFKINNNNSS